MRKKIKMKNIVILSAAVVVLAALGVCVWLWPKQQEIVSPQVDVVARIRYPGGSLECVDLYYGAVRRGDHRQYQVCLCNPVGSSEFDKRVAERSGQMKASGFMWDVAPVKKGEPGIKGVPDKVWATSPWTDREEEYSVVKQGQYWKIVEER